MQILSAQIIQCSRCVQHNFTFATTLLRASEINTLSRGEYSYRVSLRLAFPSRGPQLARPSLRGPAQARASWSTRNVHKATNAKSAARGVRQKAHTSHRSQPRKSRLPRIETNALRRKSAAGDCNLHLRSMRAFCPQIKSKFDIWSMRTTNRTKLTAKPLFLKYSLNCIFSVLLPHLAPTALNHLG